MRFDWLCFLNIFHILKTFGKKLYFFILKRLGERERDWLFRFFFFNSQYLWISFKKKVCCFGPLQVVFCFKKDNHICNVAAVKEMFVSTSPGQQH